MLLSEYDDHCCSSSDQTTIQEVFNMSSSFWVSDHTYSEQTVDRIPVVEQRRLIELVDVQDRSLEELQYCISDILNMYEYYKNVLTQLNISMCNEVSSCCQTEFESLDISESHDVYLAIGNIISSTSIPKPTINVLSASIAKAEYTVCRLQRIKNVATNLIMAYWTDGANSDRQQYIKKAFTCSNEPICVPQIQTLNISGSAESTMDNEDQLNNTASTYTSSDESYCTDTETDISDIIDSV